MKKKITILFLFFCTFSVFAQNLQFENNCISCYRAIDTKINIRKEPNTNSKILGQLSEPEIIYVNKEKSTKEWLFCYVPKINQLAYVFSEYFCETPDYNGENGPIISIEKKSNTTITTRKHNQIVTNIYLEEGKIPIYNSYDKTSNTIGILKSGATILVTKVVTKTKEQKSENEVWFQITIQDITGWISVNQRNPYYDNNYEILFYIKLKNNYYPVRKVDYSGLVESKINIYEEPNEKSTIVAQPHWTFKTVKDSDGNEAFIPESQIMLFSEGMLELDELWMYTVYEGIHGWVKKEEVISQRGGLIYSTPENIIIGIFTPY